MVKRDPRFWFVMIMLTYGVVRLMRSNFQELPDWFKFHLTDLLFVPAMCLFSLIVIRKLKGRQLLIPEWAVFVQTGFISIYFEWYLPNFEQLIHPYTSDWVDVLCYIGGAFLFVGIQRFWFKNQEADESHNL